MINHFVDKLGSFVDLSAADVAAIAATTSSPRHFAAKQDLIREGDLSGPILVMLEGWAFRYKIMPSGVRQITGFLLPGDCCDLNAATLPAMDHSIQALTVASVATIGPAEMDDLAAQHPRVARAMYIAQLANEGALRSWIVSMGRRSSLERVAHLISELYLRAHAIGGGANDGIALPFSQIILAQALGMTPVHINRVLNELKLLGVMELRRGSLLILDPSALAQFAGFDANYLDRRMRQSGRTFEQSTDAHADRSYRQAGAERTAG